MAKLICEVCQSSDFMKQNGEFECRVCGMKYSMAEIQKLLVKDGQEHAQKVDEKREEPKRTVVKKKKEEPVKKAVSKQKPKKRIEEEVEEEFDEDEEEFDDEEEKGIDEKLEELGQLLDELEADEVDEDDEDEDEEDDEDEEADDEDEDEEDDEDDEEDEKPVKKKATQKANNKNKNKKGKKTKYSNKASIIAMTIVLAITLVCFVSFLIMSLTMETQEGNFALLISGFIELGIAFVVGKIVDHRIKFTCPNCGPKREHHREYLRTTEKESNFGTNGEGYKITYTHHYLDTYECPRCGETMEQRVKKSGGHYIMYPNGNVEDRERDPKEF